MSRLRLLGAAVLAASAVIVTTHVVVFALP
jgi:hypothetical protein